MANVKFPSSSRSKCDVSREKLTKLTVKLRPEEAKATQQSSQKGCPPLSLLLAL